MKNESGRAARKLAKALAPLLPGWSFVPNSDPDWEWACLVREDGATIRILIGGWQQEGRVVFNGVAPKFKDATQYSGMTRTSITCAQTRSPQKVADEIRRRFLPAYDIAYAEALAYVKEHDEGTLEAELVAARIAGTLDAELAGVNWRRRGDGVPIRAPLECVSRLAVQPRFGGKDDSWGHPVRVDFEVHGLDPDTAAEVLRIIREAEQRTVSEARVRVDVGESSEPLELEETQVALPLRRLIID